MPTDNEAMIDNIMQAAELMRFDKLGSNLLAVTRQFRSECNGSLDLVPDLAKPTGHTALSAMAWILLPELARRLVAMSGADAMLTRDELVIPDLREWSDADLRREINRTWLLCGFQSISDQVRNAASSGDAVISGILVSDLFGRSPLMGNMIEIGISRLIAPADLSDEDRLSDCFYACLVAAGEPGGMWHAGLLDPVVQVANEPVAVQAADGLAGEVSLDANDEPAFG